MTKEILKNLAWALGIAVFVIGTTLLMAFIFIL